MIKQSTYDTITNMLTAYANGEENKTVGPDADSIIDALEDLLEMKQHGEIDSTNGKELHIVLNDVEYLNGYFVYSGYFHTLEAIKSNEDVIYTSELLFCSFEWNRRIFVHYNGEIHEITLGKCEGTNRELKQSHVLYKLLLNGEFDWFQPEDNTKLPDQTDISSDVNSSEDQKYSITITYKLATDGDFWLCNPEEFGSHEPDKNDFDSDEDYIGKYVISDADKDKCVRNTISFLDKMLCDGIHVSYTHSHLLADIYGMFNKIEDIVRRNDDGYRRYGYVELSGNYDGTFINVEFSWFNNK